MNELRFIYFVVDWLQLTSLMIGHHHHHYSLTLPDLIWFDDDCCGLMDDSDVFVFRFFFKKDGHEFVIATEKIQQFSLTNKHKKTHPDLNLRWSSSLWSGLLLLLHQCYFLLRRKINQFQESRNFLGNFVYFGFGFWELFFSYFKFRSEIEIEKFQTKPFDIHCINQHQPTIFQ